LSRETERSGSRTRTRTRTIGSEARSRSSGVQEFRSSGVQEFRSSGVQEFRSSGVQLIVKNATDVKPPICRTLNSRRKIGSHSPSSLTGAAVSTKISGPSVTSATSVRCYARFAREAALSTNPQVPLCDLCAMLSLFRVKPLNGERSARCCLHRFVGRSLGARRRIRRQWRGRWPLPRSRKHPTSPQRASPRRPGKSRWRHR
jgi:hypothetical protein